MPVLKIPFGWQIFAVVVTPIVALVAILAALSAAYAPSNNRGGVEGASTSPSAGTRRGSPVNRYLLEDGEADVPLIEVLQAADELAKAGKLPGQPPSLIEVLLAADELNKAGKLLGQEPSLIDVLQAADELNRAGKLPWQEPSLIEVLQAADELAKAGQLPGQEAIAAPPQAPNDPPDAAADAAGWFDDAYSARVRELVNARRASAGLSPLASEAHLTIAADDYARILAEHNWFAHVGPDGSTLATRAEAAGFPFTVPLGEVLAWGTYSWAAEDMVQAWLDSAPHRDEILSAAYTRAGVGCYFTSPAGTTVRCVMDLAG